MLSSILVCVTVGIRCYLVYLPIQADVSLLGPGSVRNPNCRTVILG